MCFKHQKPLSVMPVLSFILFHWFWYVTRYGLSRHISYLNYCHLALDFFRILLVQTPYSYHIRLQIELFVMPIFLCITFFFIHIFTWISILYLATFWPPWTISCHNNYAHYRGLLNTYHAAGECRRQVKNLAKL